MTEIVLLILLLLSATGVFAQTDTPEPTPTPEIYSYWQLPTEEVTGTPEVPQGVAFGYRVDAGEVAIALLLFIVLLLMWAFFIVFGPSLWRNR